MDSIGNVDKPTSNLRNNKDSIKELISKLEEVLLTLSKDEDPSIIAKEKELIANLEDGVLSLDGSISTIAKRDKDDNNHIESVGDDLNGIKDVSKLLNPNTNQALRGLDKEFNGYVNSPLVPDGSGGYYGNELIAGHVTSLRKSDHPSVKEQRLSFYKEREVSNYLKDYKMSKVRNYDLPESTFDINGDGKVDVHDLVAVYDLVHLNPSVGFTTSLTDITEQMNNAAQLQQQQRTLKHKQLSKKLKRIKIMERTTELLKP